VKIGFHLPQWGPGATREGVLAVARTVEGAGLDSVWVADHVVHPRVSASRYPYTPDGDTGWQAEDGWLEGFQLLALVAGATERVTLGTSILVLPIRHPLLVAKTAATLDVLSGGRLVLGVGVGWWAEEFAALGIPFERRGARADEQIRIMRAAWRDGRVAWRGDFYEFDEVVCLPRPVQPGGVPLWIGGRGPRTWRRAGELGDGWHGVGARSDRIDEGRAGMLAAAEQAGRPAGELSVSTSTVLPDDPEDALRRLRRLEACGVDHAILMHTESRDAAGLCAAIERFADEVLPVLRAEGIQSRGRSHHVV
jgi:probable F420-dependent oxidoreductase